MRIRTVCGDINADDFGFCQSHEHLTIRKGRSAEINPALCIDDLQKTEVDLKQYKEAGGDAVIDAQPVGCGRDTRDLVKLSENSGVHILASTGFHRLCFYPEDHWIRDFETDRLAGVFAEELLTGTYTDCDHAPPKTRSRAKAGQIKTALEKDWGELQEKLFTAAASAAMATGAPMMVHTEKGSDPEGLLSFLEAKGVSADRVIFCHMDRMIPDISVHKRIADKGSYLEYDTIARPKAHSDETELGIVREMMDAGYESRLLMSLDVTRNRLAGYGSDIGLSYLIVKFLPLMRANGIAEEQIGKIFRSNPQTAFALRKGRTGLT